MRPQLSLEELQGRLLKLERQNRQLKWAIIAFLFAVTACWISAGFTAHAQTTKAPAVKPVEDRVSALETSYRSLSLKVAALQNDTTALKAIALEGTYDGPTKSEVSDLRDDIDAIKEKVGDLEDDLDEIKTKTDDIDSIKSDVDDLKDDMDHIKSSAEEFKVFRKAICSFSWNASAYTLLHTGYPEPCPLF